MSAQQRAALEAADLALADIDRDFYGAYGALERETTKRIWDAGGPQPYIAAVRAQIKEALK